MRLLGGADEHELVADASTRWSDAVRRERRRRDDLIRPSLRPPCLRAGVAS